MTDTAVQLPHWDMSVVYPGLESAEFERDFAETVGAISDLVRYFDSQHIDKNERSHTAEDVASVFDAVTERFTAVSERLHTVFVYINCFVTTDSRDTMAQARFSEMQQHAVRLTQLETRFAAWLESVDSDALVERSLTARELHFFVRNMQESSRHLMLPGEEMLASELSVTGSTAWTKLHGTVSSQMTVPIEIDGRSERVPMSVARNMAHDDRRDVRRRAYEAEIEAWKTVEVPMAAALNSIKGETNTLVAHRHWDSPLDLALFNNRIDRETLDVMLEAAKNSFPDFRRYYRAKARALGINRLTWYDLFAPVGVTHRSWQFDEARDFLLDQFGSYSDRLRAFAERAFREHWIDAEPRQGKRDGAFCVRLRGDESRVLANYRADYDGMSTVAHELGHAYHNFNLASRPYLQRVAPMTLAETASIFCETIVREAALERADAAEQLAILELSLQGTSQVVVDITSRFLFETGVFDRRKKRELSVPELNELMLDTQRQTYGDGLDEEALHPYMWAVKGHYYSAVRPYYNFPYMFGLLFGLGLYARYRRDPEVFRHGYDDLLSSTGTADVATLAARFDIDVRSPDFWNGSLDIVRTDISRIEALVGVDGA